MQHARVPCVCACTLALRIPLHAPHCVQTFPHALVPAVAGHCGGSDVGRARAHVHVHVLCDLGFTMMTPANLLSIPVALPSCAPRASWGSRASAVGKCTRRASRCGSACVPIDLVGACVCVSRGPCDCFCGASLAPRCVRPRGPEFGTARRAPILDQKGVTGLFVTPFWSKNGARQAVLVSGPPFGPGIGASRRPLLL